MDPPAGMSRGEATSAARSAAVPSPQSKSRSGSAAARAAPCARPTLVSSADDTTAGRPASATMFSARRTPPRGCALTIRMSAAPARATASGSSALRTDSSAAIGMSQSMSRRRISASSSTVAHGCSMYSKSNSLIACAACSASSTFHPAFASIRMRPSGPSADRTARTRATSSASDCPRSATLTFAVRHPSNLARTSGTCAGSTAGTVAFTGMRSRRGCGCGCHAKSSAAASHIEASSASYSRKGENSAHPSGPWTSAASRRVTPRNGVVIGSETTRVAASTSATSGSAAESVGGVISRI